MRSISPSILLLSSLILSHTVIVLIADMIGPDSALFPSLYLYTEMQSLASPLDESLSWSRMHG